MKKSFHPVISEDDIQIEMSNEFPQYLPLREVVFQTLKKAILDGSLKPGQLLSENKIASKLSVSRTPVREALRSLEIEKLVTTLSGRRVIVSIPTAQDIEDIYGIRLLVETEALRRITPDQTKLIEQLEECVSLAEIHLEKADLQELGKKNTVFHSTIISSLKNYKLKQFIDSLQDTISRFRLYSLRDKSWAIDSETEHKQILTHLKSGNTDLAIGVLRKHLETAKQVTISMFFDQI